MTETRTNEVFNLLKMQGIIKKSGGKFYFSEKAQNGKISRAAKTVLIVLAIVFAIFIVLVIIGISSDNSTSKTKNSDSKNSTTNSTSKYDKDETEDKTSQDDEDSNKEDDDNKDDEDFEYEDEHIIDIAKMKFVPKDDLIILTDEEIEMYYGTEYTFYEIIAINLEGTRFLYCFIDDDSEVKDLTAEEYLKDTLSSNEYEKIETVTISGFEFATTRLSFEQGGKKYSEDCYVYKVDNKFVCFDYCYLESEESNFDKMIEK